MAVISRHHAESSKPDQPGWTDELGSIPLIVTLILPLVIGVVILLKCMLNHCCLRKTTTKEEMFGVEGTMTMISNSESGYIGNNNSTLPSSSTTFTSTSVTNHHPTALRTESVASNSNNNTKLVGSTPASRTASLELPSPSDAVDGHGTLRHHHVSSTSDSYETLDLTTDSLKRSTVHRQLPDLPQGSNPPRRSSSVLSHDGTSELYATVEEVPNTSGASSTVPRAPHLYSNIGDPYPNKASSSRTANLTAGSSQPPKKGDPSSDSETYGNSTHPYAKLKRQTVEHPYARVKTRTGSTETPGDEETDTDNYDISHPYAQITARRAGGPSSERPSTSSAPNNNNTDESQSSTSGSANVNVSTNPSTSTGAVPIRGASVESEESGGQGHPVPPRRAGRQWRRSHPQAQQQPGSTNDNQVHFSGDSQDSRGYTSISVREPLSNIRNQALPRRYDSHYATVSDDSEEMYAAIEDPSGDGNYMRIPGDETRQWQGVSNFERREANSPLPPVPPPLSPIMVSGSEVSPTASTAVPRDGPPSQSSSPAPPIYAQVSKKKKSKAPGTPGGGTGTTLSSHPTTSATPPIIDGAPAHSTSINASNVHTMPSSSATAASIKRRHHHAAILDPAPAPDSADQPRRWSKADISYSEFDIIREPCFPDPPIPYQSKTPSIIDEDNYNVIPEARTGSRGSKQGETDNYQEIKSMSHATTREHPYQEIPGRGRGRSSSPSDYYQEINEIKKPNTKARDNMYQKIRRKSAEGEESDDEDEEDQFYEKVKVKSAPIATNTNLNVNPNAKKHGYEKLKRKTDERTNTTRVEIVGSDEEEELYEQVKYPPYERLQESADNLHEGDGDNMYEDIGYARVKKSKKVPAEAEWNSMPMSMSSGARADEPDSPTVDLDQLYARVDMTKKTMKNSKKRESQAQVEALEIHPVGQHHDHSIEYI